MKWKVELSNRSLYGTDWKERTTLACKMNMIVHGDGSAGIVKHHGLTDVPGQIEEDQFHICVTNPPFGSIENDPAILKKYELGAGRKSQDRMILAVERALRLVRADGVVAIVVIDGMLNNDSTAHVRKYIRQHARIRGVISLPAVTFQGYNARAKTSILFLEKKSEVDETEQQGSVFMSVVGNTGYAPNGAPVPGNELPEVLLDFKAFLRGNESHAHGGSWIGALGDRMDAEFYRKRPPIVAPTERQMSRIASGAASQLSTIASELSGVQAEIRATFAKLDTVAVPLSKLFEVKSKVEKINRDQSYQLLGVKWWGCGTFVREEKTGSQIKGTRLNRVSEGWLIYNRLFAFRGSFAIVPPEHDGRHVSLEFPTFAVRESVLEPALVSSYVVHCLNSPQYLDEVDRISTGSTKTSRNRYKENRFLEMRVAIPRSISQMRQIVALLDRASALRQQHADALEGIKEFSLGVSKMLPMAELDETESGMIEILSPKTTPRKKKKPG